MCPAVFVAAPLVNVREEGLVRNGAIFLPLGGLA
jgi:transposase-like protein